MTARKVVYEHLVVEVCASKDKEVKLKRSDELDVDRAKELIGWESEADSKEEFGKDFLFRDIEGNKIRLKNNLTNRPFSRSLALRYANEMLRGKWQLNAETWIIDKKAMSQSCQHRLVAVVFAEQMRLKNKEQWKEYGTRGPITVPCILALGIDDSPDVVDTLDLGKGRSLGDVVYRNHDFGDDSDKERQQKSSILAGALKLVWIRLGGRTVSNAPHFPHSEALDFNEKHVRIREAVDFIYNENGGAGVEGNKIKNRISMAYAAALLYLMATAKTKFEKYETEGADALSFSLWDKACEFWTLFASGAGLEKDNPILALRHALDRIDAGAAASRDERVSMVIKAFNLWLDKNTASAKDIKIEKRKVDGKLTPVEFPRLGGLDIEHVLPDDEEEEVEEDTDEEEEKAPRKGKPAASKPKTGKPGKKSESNGKFRKGEWIWVNDPEGEHWKAKFKNFKEHKGKTYAVVTAEDGDDYMTQEEISHDKPE
jgi:hypothetical protein